MATLEIRDVRKSFGKAAVVHGVSICVEKGEFVVIVGPSGCGKSTLLRMVAGLEEVTGGEIVIGGRVVNDLEPKDRDIAMVFQNYALYPHMRVYDNMAYGLKIRGMSREEIDGRVREAARILELEALLDRKPRQLSGGQRQRVAMGRAIVRHPKVFLFDEPLSNLDAKLRVQMRLELQKLHRRLGVTSLYVTHDQVEAMTLGQRIIVMNAGRAEQIGTPREIYDRPQTTFVAGFIGSPPMNLIAGRLSADGAELQAEGEAVRLPAPVASVRPEQLRAGGGQLRVGVEMAEALGADHLVHCSLGTQPLVLRTAEDLAPAAGGSITLGFDAGAVHWFDPATTRRIDVG
ncbi:MAG: transporter family protein [Burkholderiaceae bacterium]|nr:transporter family protein [Burkholderiaceae bacterium]